MSYFHVRRSYWLRKRWSFSFSKFCFAMDSDSCFVNRCALKNVMDSKLNQSAAFLLSSWAFADQKFPNGEVWFVMDKVKLIQVWYGLEVCLFATWCALGIGRALQWVLGGTLWQFTHKQSTFKKFQGKRMYSLKLFPSHVFAPQGFIYKPSSWLWLKYGQNFVGLRGCTISLGLDWVRLGWVPGWVLSHSLTQEYEKTIGDLVRKSGQPITCDIDDEEAAMT